MQTGQVQNISGGLMYTTKNTSVKSKDNGFEQLMQMSQNSVVSDAKSEKLVSASSNVKKEEEVRTTEDAAVATEDTAKESNPKLTKGETAKEVEVSDAEKAEKVSSLLCEVKELVQDALGLSEDELNAFMEQMGLTEADLLNADSLQNLFLMAKQQDAVMLLTDAELFGQVQQLMAQVETLLSEAGITAEEISGWLEEPEFETLVQNLLNEADNADGALDELQQEDKMTENSSLEVSEGSVEGKSATIDFRTSAGSESGRSEEGQQENHTTENNSFVDQFIQNMQNAVENVAELSGKSELAAQIREIADQILEQIKITITPEITSMDMVLTPDELGRVNLTVTEQDGVMKASFVTENEVAKEAIESNLIQFKEMLIEQGLKVDSIEVAVGNFEFDKNGQAKQSGQEEKKNGKHQFNADAGIEQVTEADQLAQHFMDGGESTVNYMV